MLRGRIERPTPRYEGGASPAKLTEHIWSPTKESNLVSSAYKAAASSAMLVGQIGAEGWNRTNSLRLTKALLTHMSFTGIEWRARVELNHEFRPSQGPT